MPDKTSTDGDLGEQAGEPTPIYDEIIGVIAA